MSASKDDAGKRAGSGIQSNFAHASPESMVNPPGAPQSSAGSIAGKDAADVPGGVSSQIEASRNAQSGRGRAPGDGAGDGRGVVNSSGGPGSDRDS